MRLRDRLLLDVIKTTVTMVLLVRFSRILRVETHFELGFRPEGQPYLSRTSLPKLQGLLCWSIVHIAFLC